jgi:hypothetical protein
MESRKGNHLIFTVRSMLIFNRIVFLEFDNEEYASHAKDIFERT